MRYIHAVLALLCAVGVTQAGAQSAVLRLPGKSVEVIGLHRWTIPMIQDSLARYAPGRTIESHACAAALRYELGFADAMALSIRMEGDTLERMVLTLVEPQDSARVRFRAVAMDTTPPREEWNALREIMRERPWLLAAAVSRYGDRPPLRRGPDSAGIVTLWRFLDEHRSEADGRLARRTLLEDTPSLYDRAIASALLINFPENDTTWWALLETMRESDGMAKQVAGEVLGQLAFRTRRQVNWEPAAGSIHTMLDGTSVAALADLIQVLNLTGVRREWAGPFLSGGGRMLLAYAAAEHEMIRDPARELLRALSGEDYGENRRAWEHWVQRLPARPAAAPSAAGDVRPGIVPE